MIVLHKRVWKQFSEEDMEKMKWMYRQMTLTNFCKMWNISSTRAVKLFGTKRRWRTTQQIDKTEKIIDREKYRSSEEECRLRERENAKRRLDEVMETTWLKDWEISELNVFYTMAEIQAGKMVNGKWIPKELIKISK